MKTLIVMAALVLTLAGFGCGANKVGYREVQRSYVQPTDSGSYNMGENRDTYNRNYGM